MRDDMAEIIVERPRLGSRSRFKRRSRRFDGKVSARHDPDVLPHQLGMLRAAKHNGRYKTLNENLRPLLRYLESQINRPWDKVWSEISENLKVTSTVQQHVRDHVTDFVAIRTINKDGAIWVPTSIGRLVRLANSHYRLFVDARTGILRKNKHFKTWQQMRRETEAAAEKHRSTRMRELSDRVQLHRFDDGAWWEVRIAPVPTQTYTSTHAGRPYIVNRVLEHTDVVKAAKLTTLPVEQLYGRPDVYAAAKRQLSRKEILALSLPR